jgi:hypothetical protein
MIDADMSMRIVTERNYISCVYCSTGFAGQVVNI